MPPYVHRAPRSGFRGQTRRAPGVARAAARRRAAGRHPVAVLSRPRPRAGPHRSREHGAHAARLRQLSLLALAGAPRRVGRRAGRAVPSVRARPPRVCRHRRAGRQPLGARLRHASSGHAALSGRREVRPGSLELDPGDGCDRGPDVRRRVVDLYERDAPARPHRQVGVQLAGRHGAADLRRQHLQPAASLGDGPHHRRSSAARSLRSGAGGPTAIAMWRSLLRPTRALPDTSRAPLRPRSASCSPASGPRSRAPPNSTRASNRCRPIQPNAVTTSAGFKED